MLYVSIEVKRCPVEGGAFDGGSLRMPLLGLSRRAVVESRVRHARRKDTTPHHIPASGGVSLR